MMFKKHRKGLALSCAIWITVLAAGIGCQSSVTEDSPLVVFAASSLTDAFTALGAAYEQEHPGRGVEFNFAGTQILVNQLKQGAEADLLASADPAYVEEISQLDMVEVQDVLAHNRLVLAVHPSMAGEIRDITDLTSPVHLVIAGQNVPVGRYTRQALEQLESVAGKDFAERVLANVVSEEVNVRQVLAKVILGEADAGFVYASDVQGKEAEVVVRELPAAAQIRATYLLARLKGAPHPEAAADFYAFVLSRRGREILTSWGFDF